MTIPDIKTRWKVAAACALSIALTFIDQTAVNIALPSIQNQLQISVSYLHWVFNAYLLTLAMFLLLGGNLGDRYGNKNIFIAGVSLFALASAACALSPNGLMLIIGRAIQGFGGALMLPNSSAIVIGSFPDNMRGKVMGTLISFTSIFLILGPVLGGVLSQYLSWRYVFWINLPVTIVSIFMMAKYGPKPIKNTKEKIDWLGFGLTTSWLFALVFSLMESTEYGWKSPLIIFMLCAAVVLFVLFIKHQSNKQNPFVDLLLFRNKVFRSAAFLYAGIQMVFIINVFFPIYTQRVLGLSPALAGILAIPSSLPIILLSRFAGRLRDTYGPRLPMMIGFSLLTIGNVWLCLTFWTYNIYLILLGSMCFTSAAPFIFGNANTTALSVVDAKIRGIAAGVTASCRQLGGTISMAVLGTFIVYIRDSSAHYFLQTQASSINKLHPAIISDYLAGNERAINLVQHFPPALKSLILEGAQHAYMLAVTVAGVLTTLISLICLVVATRLPSHSGKPLKIEEKELKDLPNKA